MGIPETYLLEDNIYLPLNPESFDYSDGDEVEEYIQAVITNASDIAVGSEELQQAIKDWATLYHLSSRRADLIRPLSEQLQGKTVLEIGCGCGAITRFLGELGCRVIALEGSSRRASIAASRCRDLENVTVICDNFQNFEWNQKFDFVTLIGVLEYSNLFIQSADPALTMLQKAKSYLIPSGNLILAIENKLGLKYWAGAPEDHVSIPYFGIENRYNQTSPLTFGRLELSQLLTKADFTTNTFFYPYPDYKFSDVIITESGFNTSDFKVSTLLLEKFDFLQSQSYTNNFSTSLAADSLERNALLQDFSNSFLILAGSSESNVELNKHILAYSYSTGRKRYFCKENLFLKQDDGSVEVLRKKIHPNAAETTTDIRQQITNELFISGSLFFEEAVFVVSKHNWTLAELQDWALKYYQVLSDKSYQKDGSTLLDAKYLDLAPFNIIKTDAENYSLFDLEWIYKEDLPIYYVFFRGIFQCLNKISHFNFPGESVPLNILQLAISITRNVTLCTELEITECLEREKEFIESVSVGKFIGLGYKEIQTKNIVPTTTDILSLAEPLEVVLIQIFWQENQEHYFTEEKSLKQYVPLSAEVQAFTFPLPPFSQNSFKIRIDPSEKCGSMYLYAIKVYNSINQELFSWNTENNSNLTYQNILLLDSSFHADRSLLIGVTNDPILEFDITGYEINTPVFVEIRLSAISQQELKEEFNKNNVHDFSQKLETIFIQRKHKSLLQENADFTIESFKKELQHAIALPLNNYFPVVEEIRNNQQETISQIAAISKVVENNIIASTTEINRQHAMIDAISKEKLYTDLQLALQNEKLLRSEHVIKATQEKADLEQNFLVQTKSLENQIALLTQHLNELQDKLIKNESLVLSLQKDNNVYKTKYEDKSLWSIIMEKMKE